jgi:Pentapeptide repeats (8 copies)
MMRRLLRHGRRSADAARWDVLAGSVGVLVLLVALIAVIVYLPPLAIDSRGLSRNDWLTHVESLRATILQGLGGLALLGTLYFSARTLRLNRRGQLTERFSKAIEQLGSGTLAVRLGGIYALEQIALDSRELHWPVMEVLTAYLREHARVDASTEAATTTGKRLAADHQVIATVIGRRRREHDSHRLELSETDLRGVQWRGANLQRANLWRANLGGAYLRFVHFEGARLEGANLSDARLERAYLGQARLEGANLVSAWLGNTDLSATQGLTLEQLLLAGDLTGASLPGELAQSLELAINDPTAPAPELPPEPADGRPS